MARVTVFVLHTLGSRNWCTANIGISCIADWTATLSFMFGHQAFCILCTRVLVQAEVDTVLVPACLVLWTLRVTPASDDLTCNEWIAFVARNTFAIGPMLGSVALSKSTAGILYQTRIHAITVDTCFLVSTFPVTLATHWFTSNLRIANKTWGTHTHRFVVLDKARGA